MVVTGDMNTRAAIFSIHDTFSRLLYRFGWLVVFGFNDSLRQYFRLYWVVSQREGERKEKGQLRVKMSKQSPPAPTASAVGPCPNLIQTSRTPRTWKFIQDHPTTRPPPFSTEPYSFMKIILKKNQNREHYSLNNHGEITQKVCKQEMSFLYALVCCFWIERPFETVFQSLSGRHSCMRHIIMT